MPAFPESQSQTDKPASAVPMKPVPSGERYLTLDTIRGLSLLGVLLVNDLDFFRVSLFEQIAVFHTHPGWGNRLVDVLVAGLLEFKAFTLFSFLFGLGIGIQTERLTGRGAAPYRFLARRLGVLLVFGLIHMFLISNVDILCLYAVCGVLLMPLLRYPAPLLAGLGLGAIALRFTLPFGSLFPSGKMMQEHATLATSIYSAGSFHEILVFRWQETWQFVLPLQLSVLPQTFGLMLLGIGTWRAGIVQRPAQHRRLLIAISLGGGTAGGIASSLVVFKKSCGRAAIESVPSPLIEASSYIPLALACASAFLLWMTNRRSGSLLQSVAAVGQMALTNYLLQSVILGLIFYSYGFGLMGRLGPMQAGLIGVIIYLGQLGASRAWLRHHCFGPAEWVWRSLTYGERQPMRVGPESYAPAP